MSGDIIIPSGTGGTLVVEIDYNGPAGPPGTNGTNGTNGTDGVGVPAGGTTGQILAKNSNTDYDTEWVDDAGSGTTIAEATEGSPGVGDFIPYLTAALAPGKVEGDYYAVAASMPELIRDTMGTALVAGANITITVNDAGDTITIAASGGSGSTLQLATRSGAWFGSGSGTSASAIMGFTGRIFYVPLLVPASMTIDRIGINVQTGDAGTNAKLGIYNSDANRLPSTLITACAAPVSTATSGLKEGTFSSNPTLAAGLYYLAWQSDSTAFTLQPYVVSNAAEFWLKNSIGTTNYGGSEVAIAEGGTYASGLPATATPAINVGGWFYPVMSVRVA
jgi:hypothetical protein